MFGAAGILETFLLGLEMIRPEEVKKQASKASKTRTSNETKYRDVHKDRNEDEIEQVRIPAENHRDSEKLRNIDGPWGIKVRVKGQGRWSGEVWGVHIGSVIRPLSRITAHTRAPTPPDKYVPLYKLHSL